MASSKFLVHTSNVTSNPNCNVHQVYIWSGYAEPFPDKISEYVCKISTEKAKDTASNPASPEFCPIICHRDQESALKSSFDRICRFSKYSPEHKQVHVIIPTTHEIIGDFIGLTPSYRFLITDFAMKLGPYHTRPNHYFIFCNYLYPARCSLKESQKIQRCNEEYKKVLVTASGGRYFSNFFFLDIAFPLSESNVYIQGDLEMFKNQPRSLILNSYGYECLANEIMTHLYAKIGEGLS